MVKKVNYRGVVLCKFYTVILPPRIFCTESEILFRYFVPPIFNIMCLVEDSEYVT